MQGIIFDFNGTLFFDSQLHYDFLYNNISYVNQVIHNFDEIDRNLFEIKQF